MWATIRLIHPFPATLVTLTSIVFIVVLRGALPEWDVLLRAFGVVAGSQVAVGALNEYIDRDADARIQPDKPLPAGLVSPTVALALVASGIPCVVGLSATFGPLACGVACLGTAGGLAYDLWLKPTSLSLLGYLIGFLSLISWIRLITGRFSLIFLLVYPAGALLVVAAHLAQSFPDIERDSAAGNAGLAVRLGAVWTLRVIASFSLVVSAGGLGIAIYSGRIDAVACTVAATAVLIVSLVFSRSAAGDVQSRKLLFYPVAASLALTGAGSLLALSSLS